MPTSAFVNGTGLWGACVDIIQCKGAVLDAESRVSHQLLQRIERGLGARGLGERCLGERGLGAPRDLGRAAALDDTRGHDGLGGALLIIGHSHSRSTRPAIH